MAFLETAILAVGVVLALYWFTQLLPKPKDGLTIGSIETLSGGVGITLMGLSACSSDEVITGLALLAIGVPLTLAYAIEKYNKKRSS